LGIEGGIRMEDKNIKEIIKEMIVDGDIRLLVEYDRHEHEMKFSIEVCTEKEETTVEQERIYL